MIVQSTEHGSVTVLTLNRDEKRNALSTEVVRALIDAISAAQPSSRALVLTGAGTVFSSGADLDEDKVNSGFFDDFAELVKALRASVPVVAYINGPAIGAGMMLSMACDVRLVAPSAYFALPVGDMAIGIDQWVVATLASLVGGSRARAMLMTGMRLSADDAVSCGYAFSGDIARALGAADLIAAKAPLTMRNIKYEFAPDMFSTQERLAAQQAPFESSDIAEASLARSERRSPRFTGR